MAFGSFVKSFLIPFIISAILYALIFFVLLPIYRHQRARYAEYLPLGIGSNSLPNTSGLRHRVVEALVAFFPSFRWAPSWMRPGQEGVVDATADDGEGDEELDETLWDGPDTNINFRSPRPENHRRLSRDLEQGFRDSSDEEDD